MKTAIEWLEDEAYEVLAHLPIEREAIKKLIEQAKAMEKEQTMQDYSVGYSNGQVDSNRTAEQYYNETFKSE